MAFRRELNGFITALSLFLFLSNISGLYYFKADRYLLYKNKIKSIAAECS